MHKSMIQVRRSVAMAVLATALLVGGALTWGVSSNDHLVFGAPGVTLQVATAENSAKAATSFAEGFADVVEPLLPAVVNISSSRVVTRQEPRSPFEDPLFRRFFGEQFGDDPTPEERRQRGLGSGVIVSPDGYILTNNHVVEGASEIQVSLMDKRQLKATVVGMDPRTDLAVLKIPASDLTPVTLGDSTQLRVGDVVLAIGNPFGLGETVTMGIVSATGRRSLGIAGPGGYEDFIQTDAAINPGNSGGALVNTRGELVGINTAIISNRNGGNQGIGFAIPVAMARGVMEQILTTGKVTRGYLGVMIQEVTPELAKVFGISSPEGALIADVTPDGPGAKASLQKGDVVVGLNGEPVSDYSGFRLRVSQMAPGTTVKLDIIRKGQKQQITATLEEFPETQAASATPEPEPGENVLEGVQVRTLTPEIGQQLNLPGGTRGVVISRVDPNSTAADAGLRRGDVIQEVNHNPVGNVQQFRAALRDAGNQPVLLLINRAGATLFAVISP